MHARILAVIVVAQFLCTSVWFAGNAVLTELVRDLGLGEGFIADLTSAVQFGFISGTLAFALLAIADRYAPSRVFFFSAIIAALFNLLVSVKGINITGLLTLRFATGFFLAGIYPVGMKIASDYAREGLGKSLGFLVGALVLGTAVPHLIRDLTIDLNWKAVLYGTSALCITGGLAMLAFVPDGPYRKAGQQLKLTAFLSGFRDRDFRAAATGYFGHMWELYAFWAFVPIILKDYAEHFPDHNRNISTWSFLIIGAGSLACITGGYLSQYYGAKRIATLSLILSGLCCVLSPLVLNQSSEILFLTFLFFWGFVVIADSPLFSSLIARFAPPETRGTSLTIVNCIGFAITIVSIQLLSFLSRILDNQFLYLILAIGPVTGVLALIRHRPVA